MNTGTIALLSLGLGALTIALVISGLQAKAAKNPAVSPGEPGRKSGPKSHRS